MSTVRSAYDRSGSQAAVVARLMVRPVRPQLRKCRVRPCSYAWCHDRTSRNLVSSRSTSGLGFYWETITSIGSRIKRRFLIRSLDRSNGLGIRPRAGLRDRAAEMDEARSPVLFLRSCKRTSAPSRSAKAPDNSEAKTAALGPASARNAVKAFEHSRPV
jgi:hypothetical protein